MEFQELSEEVGRRIVHRMVGVDAVFECDGISKMTVKMQDGEYRKKAVLAGTKFYLDGAYLGKQGGLIFVLTPLENLGEIAKVEVSARDGDGFFPLMGGQIARAFGNEEIEALKDAIDHVGGLVLKEHADLTRKDEEIVSNNPLWGAF